MSETSRLFLGLVEECAVQVFVELGVNITVLDDIIGVGVI